MVFEISTLMLLFTLAAAEALDTLVVSSLESPELVSDVVKDVPAGSRVMSNADDMPVRLVLPSANEASSTESTLPVVPPPLVKLLEPPPMVRIFLMSADIEGIPPSSVDAPRTVEIFPSRGFKAALLSIFVPAMPLMLEVTPNALPVPTERVALEPLVTLIVTDCPGPASCSAGIAGAVWAMASGAKTA